MELTDTFMRGDHLRTTTSRFSLIWRSGFKRQWQICVRHCMAFEQEDKQWLLRVRVMVFNATFNNFSVILWRSALLVEETGVPRENYLPAMVVNIITWTLSGSTQNCIAQINYGRKQYFIFMFKLTLHRIHRRLLSVLKLNFHILVVLVHLLPAKHSHSFNIHPTC